MEEIEILTEGTMVETREDKGKKEKKHLCSICGRESETTICHACEDKIRAEALEKKHDVEKAGRTDSGRR
ncbi:MAG: hypothetical protein HZB22_01910 [Deltaproteobacteria bacterium]|nr:hypothetical protein [Deltaproteobacteria bacterium]